MISSLVGIRESPRFLTGPTSRRGKKMTMPNVPAVSVEGLVCKYREFVAVNEVSFTVDQGELFAVVGPNGAGKTTLLETLQGLRTVSAGKVRVFGIDPRNRSVSHSRMGIMFQESGLLSDLTVRETIATIGPLTGRSDNSDHVVERVGLSRLAGSRVSQLSGGERRRLDFALAIYGAPRLIFLDEPTTGLDPVAREELWKQVAVLRNGGATIILTTHYLEEVENYATRIGFMKQGRMAAQGKLHEVLSASPRHIRFRYADDVAGPVHPYARRSGSWNIIPVSDLQSDLLALLVWADSMRVRLDDVQIDSGGLRDYFMRENKGIENVG
ncbi:ABC transporter ATP-binding protein [Rathayibacter toxicus]|nr:ABC transporter ATP-binding protein [Rathayibacter toxicus]